MRYHRSANSISLFFVFAQKIIDCLAFTLIDLFLIKMHQKRYRRPNKKYQDFLPYLKAIRLVRYFHPAKEAPQIRKMAACFVVFDTLKSLGFH